MTEHPAPVLEEDALPHGWSQWIAAEAAARGCPADYVAAALIAAASAWIGNSRHISATPSWTQPPHLWVALIGPPSTGKTPALQPFVEASRTLERDAEPLWQTECTRHALIIEIAKEAEERWRADVKTAIKQRVTPPERPADTEVPAAPPRPRTIAMDTTTEELQRLLAETRRGLLYKRDELAGWFGNHDRYGGHGGDRAFYLESWDGGTFVIDRVKNHGAPLRIARTALGILGGLQPDRLREVLAGADDGLAARLAYVWPDPAPIQRLKCDDDAEALQRRDQLLTAARRLYGLPMVTDVADEPGPKVLPLTPAAFRLFDDLRMDAIQQARTIRGLAAGWHGKTPNRALRLALVFELLAWARVGDSEPPEISGEAIARAGGYVDYLAAMLDRVAAGLAIGRTEADASVIARHIMATRPAMLNEREIYQQRGWAWLRAPQRREAAFQVLAAAGWIRPFAPAGSGRPRGDWEVSPLVTEQRA